MIANCALKTFLNARKSTTYLLIATFVLAGVQMVPSVSAYGKANWQFGFAGTFITPGVGNDGFWGWCAFVGVSSGTDGDCQVSNYFHFANGPHVTCETSVSVTGWDMEPPTIPPPPGFPADDFFITSATLTVNPSSPACLSIFGSLPTPFDTGFPAAPGHYNFNGLLHLFGQTGELQVQVTQIK